MANRRCIFMRRYWTCTTSKDSKSVRGVLTLNYDEYIETAITRMGHDIDFGIDLGTDPSSEHRYRLLKLHGSFGWKHTWPISRQNDYEAPFWIPPGILSQRMSIPSTFSGAWHTSSLIVTS